MTERQHQRQASNFTFHSKWPSPSLQQPQHSPIPDPSPDQYFLFEISSLEQQLQNFQEQQERQRQNSPRKSFAPIKKQQLQKVFKFFKKYQPMYFSKIQVKEMTFKFKKEVFIKKYNEGYYFGQVMQIKQDEKYTRKIKQGRGILVYNLFRNKSNQTKRIYEGEWKNDKKSGLGFEKFEDGSVYHGNYQNNKPQGRGKFTNAHRQIYEGEWKDGIKEGKGFWQGISGQTYMGEWKNGKPEGYGVFVAQNGNQYEGEYKNALKHGEGIQRFANGDIYKGLFQNGMPSGYGEYYWKNKSYFKGYFSNGLRKGQGLWKKSAGNSDKYQGHYQNDKKWGYGVFTWANGNIFKGSYEGDLRNGYGEMFWTDGSYYKGQWKDGVQDGKGQLFVLGEGLRIGIFENNRIVEIQYEEPCQDFQNQQVKRIHIKTSQKVLQRNLSKTSQISVKSKNSKYTSLDKKKPLLTEKAKLKPLKSRPSEASFINDGKDSRDKFFSESETVTRSVPLKKLIQNTDSSRFLFKEKSQKAAQFRVSQKVVKSQKYDQSLDSSRAKKAQMPEKRRNRILHSSFYLHKFKKFKSPERELSEEHKYFKNYLNMSNLVKS